MENERPAVRIGTAERNAALQALDEHLEAGRLDIDEYGERSARASTAVTAPELAALFDDLPAPHPPLPGASRPAAPPPTGHPDYSGSYRSMPAAASAPVRRAPSGLEVWGPRLMALAPFLALGLFLITHTWFVFLLIPALGAVLGARRHGHGYGHHGRRR